ncbi:MAG TPA: SDR family NAD(P)-dependent oxidoreductase [Tepidisphaeraceae bacterium]|jgi:NAD(P)-dependent dehydrogenase (short-subunit alcohol dehydrogenase family)|nr:SDR family NAD(P)-dependent oxidoreductase [Tepidisphaeraceae bacterium]
MELAGKVCLITGGTKGIGAATAIAVARRGAAVAVVGRDLSDAEAKRTMETLKATGQRVLAIRGDMGDAEACRACVAQTAAQLGPVDLLVHSAGGPVPGGLFEVGEEAWMSAFDVHVHAIFHLCRAVVPAMKKKGEGAIVLISSSAGKRAIRTNIAYQAVKGAVPHLTRALAFELADNNIRVNCVAPGVIRTAFHDSMPESVKENNLKNRIPLHREGTIEQVASLILEMATNDYITGETFSIDGGLTMRIC